VRFDPGTTQVDAEGTLESRRLAREERLARGKPWDEFIAEWERLRPSDEALAHFGSWPDGVRDTPVIRI
jgi:hypothetical protein